MENVLLGVLYIFMLSKGLYGDHCHAKLICVLGIICLVLQALKLRLPKAIRKYVRNEADILPFYGCVLFPTILFIDDFEFSHVHLTVLISIATVLTLTVMCKMRLVLKLPLCLLIVITFVVCLNKCKFYVLPKYTDEWRVISVSLLAFILYAFFFIQMITCLESFSVGECVLLCQMITSLCLFHSSNMTQKTIDLMDISLFISKTGLFLIFFSMFCFKFCRSSLSRTMVFYSIVIFVILLLAVTYTQWLVQCMIYGMNFLVSNYPRRLYLLFVWIAVLCGCIAYVVIRSKKGKATTAERKLFHVFILLVYIPGITYDVPLLFLCSIFACVALVLVAVIQTFQIEPAGECLQMHLDMFRGKQDTGKLVLTPLYLLIGMTFPLWMSCIKQPQLLADPTSLPPIASYSGIISVGIGDAVASIVGSRYGTLKFPKRRKTVEGTLASILAQVLFVYALSLSGCIDNGSVNIIVSIIAAAFLEAYTNEIDNFVVPVVMYFLLDVM